MGGCLPCGATKKQQQGNKKEDQLPLKSEPTSEYRVSRALPSSERKDQPREAESSYRLGQHVHIFSNSKKAWIEDGCIYKIYEDGKLEIRYNEGEAAKTLAANELVAGQVKFFSQASAATMTTRACDMHRILVRKGRAGETLKISDNGQKPQKMTLQDAQTKTHYVVYPCSSVPQTTAEADWYELWPCAKIENSFTPMGSTPREVPMRIQNGDNFVHATRWGDLSQKSRPEALLRKDQLEAKMKDGFKPVRVITEWDKVCGTRPVGSSFLQFNAPGKAWTWTVTTSA